MPFGIVNLKYFLQNMPFGIYTKWFNVIKFKQWNTARMGIFLEHIAVKPQRSFV